VDIDSNQILLNKPESTHCGLQKVCYL